MCFVFRIIFFCAFFIGCDSPLFKNKGKHLFQRVVREKNVYMVRWVNPQDTLDWRGLSYNDSSKKFCLTRFKDDLAEGNQIFTHSSSDQIEKIISYKKGRIKGRCYYFYKSGRIRVIADYDGEKKCGKLYEFSDRAGCNFKALEEWILIEKKEYLNSQFIFDTTTCALKPEFCKWGVKTTSLKDTIYLGDSLIFRARVRFPAPWHNKVMVLLSEDPSAETFVASGASVQVALKPLHRGLDSVQGRILSFRYTSPSGPRQDSAQSGRMLYFKHKFYVQ